MQSPVSQLVSGATFEFKYSNFILQTQLETNIAVFSNSIRALSTLVSGDPVLSLPAVSNNESPCVVEVKLQPSLLLKSTTGVTPYNFIAKILSFGKVTPVNTNGIKVDGATINASLLGEQDSFVLSRTPSVIDFSGAFAYFANDSAFNAVTFPPDAGNVSRFQLIIDVTIRNKWQ